MEQPLGSWQPRGKIASNKEERPRVRSTEFRPTFVGKSVLAVLLLAFLGGAAYVHMFVIPLPMALRIVSAYDEDKSQWEFNIEKSELGDLGEQFESWGEGAGHSYDTSRDLQEELWNNSSVYVTGAVTAIFAIIFIAFSLVSTGGTGNVETVDISREPAVHVPPKRNPKRRKLVQTSVKDASSPSSSSEEAAARPKRVSSAVIATTSFIFKCREVRKLKQAARRREGPGGPLKNKR